MEIHMTGLKELEEGYRAAYARYAGCVEVRRKLQEDMDKAEQDYQCAADEETQARQNILRFLQNSSLNKS